MQGKCSALDFGSHVITEEQIGETALTNFQDVTEENFFNGNSTDTSNLIPNITTENSLNITLNSGDPFQTQTTAPDVNEFDVQVSFNGLIRYSDDGKRESLTVQYEIRYRPTSGGSFVAQTFLESRSTNAAFSISKRFVVAEDQYDVELRKIAVFLGAITAIDTNSQLADESSGQVLAGMTWTNLRSIRNDNPVNLDGVSLKAIRIRGTEQLNGSIDQYNCIASRRIPDWDGVSWVPDQETSNPASIFRYILLAEEAREPIPLSEIDQDSIQLWHDFCATEGFTYNAYIDFQTDRETLLKEVAASGLAGPSIVDNKYSVIIDNIKNNIVQHISQRNSYDYHYEKVFNTLPHGFRIAFINKDKDYLQDEIIVYDDGFDATNATRLEQLDFPGVVDTQALYKLARHRLAEVRLRPDMHTVTMDVENLVATKGDRVKFSHDVALIGVGSGRVLQLIDDGLNVISVLLDETLSLSNDNHSIEFRLSTGNTLTVAISNANQVTNQFDFVTQVPLANAPAIGDLATVGVTEAVTLDCIIQSIEPQNDFAAMVKLVEYAEGVFTASQGTIPVYDNLVTLPPEFRQPLPPELIAIQSDEFVQVRNLDGSISSRLNISLRNNNLFSVTTIAKIRQIGSTEYDTAETLTLSPTRVIIEGLDEGNLYDIQIFYRRDEAIAYPGVVLSEPLQINGYRFIGESSAPPSVENFDITVRSDSVFLSWQTVNVIDLAGYEVRFQPVTTGATWGSGLPLNVAISKEQTSVTVPSDIGTYMIKAFDRSGNFSENETLAITTVGALENINLVLTVQESPAWGGTFDGTVNDGGDLKLAGSDTIDDWGLVDDIFQWDFGESGLLGLGSYFFAAPVDLGEIYTSIITANLAITAVNELDLIDSWNLIDERSTFDNANPDKYNVILEVRTTNDDPSGSPVWSVWQPLRTLSEYTARGFEFRLLLSSTDVGITPVISNCTLSIDMPDRIASEDDIVIMAGGDSVVYDFAFREPPKGPEITIDDLQTGDYYVISNRTASGFDIEFFNSSAVSVERTFSYITKGFGRIP